MYCVQCGNKIADDAEFCSECGASQKTRQTYQYKTTVTFVDVKTPIYKRWWVWAIAATLLIAIIGSISGMILGIIGILGFCVCVVILIIFAITKKPKKIILILLGVFIISFVVGLSLPNNGSESNPNESVEANSQKDDTSSNKNGYDYDVVEDGDAIDTKNIDKYFFGAALNATLQSIGCNSLSTAVCEVSNENITTLRAETAGPTLWISLSEDYQGNWITDWIKDYDDTSKYYFCDDSQKYNAGGILMVNMYSYTTGEIVEQFSQQALDQYAADAEKAVLDEYKNKCTSLDYKTVARDPDKYLGQYAKFTGEVIQVQESGSSVVLRVNVTYNSYYYTDTIYVEYLRKSDSESRILENDIVTMYGTMGGLKTYTTVMNSSVSIPLFYAEYIELS